MHENNMEQPEKPESIEHLELPTDEETETAVLDFEQGMFKPIEDVMRRKFEWYALHSINSFSREAFTEGAASNGYNVTEEMIAEAQQMGREAKKKPEAQCHRNS